MLFILLVVIATLSFVVNCVMFQTVLVLVGVCANAPFILGAAYSDGARDIVIVFGERSYTALMTIHRIRCDQKKVA